MLKQAQRILLLAVLVSSRQLFAQDGSTNAPTANPRNQLQQLTAQLQQSPDDQALREKIIALALTLNPGPATPDAATMAEGAAEYAFKNAKVNSDYSDAAKQYEKAVLLAPWLVIDYFNCGEAYEKAGEYKKAIRGFSLYLLAAPNADDAQAVKKRIGGLQYAAQRAEDAANEQARAASRQAAIYPGLVDMHDGTIYDTGTQLSWLKDAGAGVKTWDQAVAWIASLNADGGFARLTGWRLPLTGQCWGSNCTNSEMGYLYYISLRNTAELTKTGPFTNLQPPPPYFWSGTEAHDLNYKEPAMFFFRFSDGEQIIGRKYSRYGSNVWAVRPGARSQ